MHIVLTPAAFSSKCIYDLIAEYKYIFNSLQFIWSASRGSNEIVGDYFGLWHADIGTNGEIMWKDTTGKDCIIELFTIVKIYRDDIQYHKRKWWAKDKYNNAVLRMSKKIGEISSKIVKEKLDYQPTYKPQGTMRLKNPWSEELDAYVNRDEKKWVIKPELIDRMMFTKQKKFEKNRIGPRIRNKSEDMCRRVLERLTGCNWPSTRNVGILGNHGRQLELDCYSEELKAAVEIQGGQHASLHYYNGHDEDRLERIRGNDDIKAIYCMEHGIKLYRVWLVHVDYKSTFKDWEDILMPFIEELHF